MHAVLTDHSKTGPVQHSIREHDALKMLKARKDFLLVQSAAKWNMRNFVLAARKRSGTDSQNASPQNAASQNADSQNAVSGRAENEHISPHACQISTDEPPRFGLTVTKRMGNAVIRNRIKRRLRAGIRQIEADSARKGYDYVLIARRGALECPFTDMIRDMEFAFRKIHEKAHLIKNKTHKNHKKSIKNKKNKPQG